MVSLRRLFNDDFSIMIIKLIECSIGLFIAQLDIWCQSEIQSS